MKILASRLYFKFNILDQSQFVFFILFNIEKFKIYNKFM